MLASNFDNLRPFNDFGCDIAIKGASGALSAIVIPRRQMIADCASRGHGD